MKRNIKLTLEYDGTDWHGWQVQNNAATIQGSLETALAKITQESIRVTGASRTDAGVHAKGQACNFYTASRIPLERIPYALNANLPESIVVLAACEVPLEFHARYQAIGKRYAYEITNRSMPCALRRHFSYHVPQALDLGAMQQAALLLQGQHDFKAFQAVGSSVKSTVRHLHRLAVEEQEAGRILILAEGDGFLYNMVRILVGTLLEVGLCKRSAVEMEAILASRDRSRAGPTVPPYGLCLEKVFYAPGPSLTLEKS